MMMCLATAHTTNSPNCRSQTLVSVFMGLDKTAARDAYNHFLDCLSTYGEKWPHMDIELMPEKVAEEGGLLHTGHLDVMCNTCLVQIGYFKDGDTPLGERKKHYVTLQQMGACSFLRNRTSFDRPGQV